MTSLVQVQPAIRRRLSVPEAPAALQQLRCAYNILDSIITPATSSASTITTAFPSGFSMGVIGTGITIGGVTFPNIGAVIQAYKTDQEVSILSTPQIMTLDNEDAEINVGENVPYITSQQSSSTTTTTSLSPLNYNCYEYQDVGVILDITPHINRVTLSV